ncbi:MAG: FtsX-like permease family protein [Ardenticatenaceae bacterium]|nr:FtsX-like permease family protein [Ardenticatenaceae bacterium]
MIIFHRIRTALLITLKRLWAQRSMTAVTTIGLTAAVAIIMVVPLYADAVSFRILEEKLSQASGESSRPSFAYMFNYIGSWAGPLQWEEVEPADSYLMGEASTTLGLPQELAVHHFETSLYQLFAPDTTNYDNDQLTLVRLSFATTSHIADYITLNEGQFPNTNTDSNMPLEILISQTLADETGWQVGEQYVAFNNEGEAQFTFPVQVAGIWQPNNPNDGFWFYAPFVFDDLMLVAEGTFNGRIAPTLDNEINLATWYWIMDGRQVGTDDVNRLISGVGRIEQQLQNLLPGSSTLLAPTDELNSYRRDVGSLSALLLAFNVPTIGLVLAFVGLVGSLAANQRRNEFAVLRSRGGTAVQVITIALLEFILLGAIAYVLGTGLGLLLTQSVSRARSFMDFSADVPLRVALNGEALQAGLFAVILAVFAQLLPILATARHTIISYKLTQARSLRPPWWQRAWLDLILIAVTAYGLYTLNQQGSLIVQTETGDPFQNPLLFWLPAITIFSVALLFLRLLPFIMRLLTWLLQQTNNVTLLQAARHLARTPHHYNTPLILLILTVSFSVFTASLARTLDYYLYDQEFYAVGSDLNLYTPSNTFAGIGGLGQASDAESSFVFLPISEYETIDGVRSAARVGSYAADAHVGTDNIDVSYMGIDPLDFGQTAYWRWDFSLARIGTLMNGLGSIPEGVLVSNSFLRRNGLRGGDNMRLTVNLEGGEIELETQIVGVFDYFPTWNPDEDEPLVVGNLNYLFEQAGSEFPFRVLLKTEGPLSERALRAALNQRQLFGSSWQDPQAAIAAALLRPERQGLFGLLSVGFIAAAALTVLGLLLYAVFSYRRRLVELGILRAVGLSARKMTALVGWELVLLILSGVVLGTVLGIGVSRLFIPYLQIGTSTTALVPPFVVEIAWDAVSQVYVLFVMLFIVALISLVLLGMRMKIFMAIKLGETV